MSTRQSGCAATIPSAADLVADRRLLKVALGAFGLEGEIDKRAFMRKVLDEGTIDPKAFANRLTDPAFRKLAEAFGFGNPGGARTNEAGFAAKIVAAYKIRAFEAERLMRHGWLASQPVGGAPTATTAESSDSIAARSAMVRAGANSAGMVASSTLGRDGVGSPDAIVPNRLPIVSTSSPSRLTSGVVTSRATNGPGMRWLTLGQATMMPSDSAAMPTA